MLGKKKKKAEAEAKTKREKLKEELAPAQKEEVKATKKPTVKKPVNPDRVAVLETNVGERLIIRSNPTQKAVRDFVAEANRRYDNGELGGPSGVEAMRVHEANYYPSELEIDDPEKAVKIKLPNE